VPFGVTYSRSVEPWSATPFRAALRKGVALQGSTLREYVTPNGTPGGMQQEFHVYGRHGEPCDRCGSAIERTVIGGRGTWFCPSCQRR